MSRQKMKGDLVRSIKHPIYSFANPQCYPTEIKYFEQMPLNKSIFRSYFGLFLNDC